MIKEGAASTETTPKPQTIDAQVTEKTTESPQGITIFNSVKETQPLFSESVDQLLERLLIGEVGEKDGRCFVRGICDGKRSNANMRGLSSIIIDGDSSLDNQKSCVEPRLVHDAMAKHEILHVIHTSYSHDPDNNINKFRLIIPCSNLTKENLKQGVSQIINLLHSEGLPVKPVGENNTLSQPWFLPRYPAARERFFYSAKGNGRGFEVTAGDTPVEQQTKVTEPITDQFTWAWFETEVSSGTLHQAMKSAVCHLAFEHSNWGYDRIKEEILSRIKGCSGYDPHKLQRAVLGELDDILKWMSNNREKWQLPKFTVLEESDEAEKMTATVERLSTLHPLELDKVIKEEAGKMGVRVTTLRSTIEKNKGGGDAPQTNIDFPDDDSWDDPVDGGQLIHDLCQVFNEYSHLPAGSSLTLSLWTILTYCYDMFGILPMVALLSPEKRCGKTTTLETLAKLCYRAIPASGISSAAVYRVVEAVKPCLLIDELDSVIAENEPLRGILNSGHRKATAFVIRCVGDNSMPETFSSWCPKAVAAIGRLPETLQDRALIVHLQRKQVGEVVTPHGIKHTNDPRFAEIRSRIIRFVTDNIEALRATDPAPLITENDRAADNWRPLLVIAKICGEIWENKAREVASRADSTDIDSIGTKLLMDIETIFDEQKCDNMFSRDLVKGLTRLEGRPWDDFSRGKRLTTSVLATLLEPFGVRPKSVRTAEGTAKGYSTQDFKDTFGRYIPDSCRHNVTSQF